MHPKPYYQNMPDQMFTEILPQEPSYALDVFLCKTLGIEPIGFLVFLDNICILQAYGDVHRLPFPSPNEQSVRIDTPSFAYSVSLRPLYPAVSSDNEASCVLLKEMMERGFRHILYSREIEIAPDVDSDQEIVRRYRRTTTCIWRRQGQPESGVESSDSILAIALCAHRALVASTLY